METQQFPLRPAKRPKLCVDRHTIKAWKRQARQEIAALLQDRESWYYKGLHAKEHHDLALVYNKHDVRGYTPFKCTAKRSPYFCHGVLNLSLEDIVYALYCDTTTDQRAVATHLYQEKLLDAAVLDVYERQSVEDPFHFAGVKWVAYRIPPGLVASPELLYFEYSCKTQDANGRTVLVQYKMSPKLSPEQIEETPNCNTGLARAKVSQISTFQFLEEGTHCQSSGWFEASASVPIWVATKSVKQIFSNTSHLVGLADARAIATLGTAASVSASKACYLCSKKFGVMMHKRHNCRACGQSICAKCTIKLKVPSRISSSLQEQQQQSSQSKSLKSVLRFVEEKFCLPCVLQAREQRPESGSFSDMAGSLSSEASNTTAPPSVDEGYEFDLSDLNDSAEDVMDDFYDPLPASHQGQQGYSEYMNNEKLMRMDARQQLFVESSIETYLSRARDTANSNLTNQQHKKRATSHPPDSGINSFGWRSGLRPQPPQVPATIAEEQPPGTWMRHESVNAQQVPAPVSTSTAELTQQLPAAFDKLSQSIAAQEALLQSIRQERNKFHARQQQKMNSSSDRRRATSGDPDIAYNDNSDRFEVITEEV